MNEVPAAPAAPAAAPANAAPVAQPEVTATPGETKPEGQQPPEKTFSQKELDDIIEKRLAKERRKREELQRRLTVTEELALRGRRDPDQPQPAKPAEDGEPKREQFGTYEEYLEARADWRADRKVEERFKKQSEEQTQTRTAQEQQKLMKDFQGHAAKVAKELEDFEEVMESSEAPMTREMAMAMLHAGEIGPRIGYHLAKNPEEAQRIAALPESRQAAEIGKLEAKLLTPAAEPKKPSKAPAPIDPVGGKKVATDDMPDPSDTKAWIAWRERQIRAKRTGT